MSCRGMAALALALATTSCVNGPVGPIEPVHPAYLVRPSGVQCITAPCPAWEAVDVRSCRFTPFDELDLSAVAPAEGDRQRLLQRFSAGHLVVAGAFGAGAGAPPFTGAMVPAQAPAVFTVSDIIGEPAVAPCQG